jgi:hypothetical protein
MQGDRDWPADTPLKVLNLNKKNRQAALWSLYPTAGSVNGRCKIADCHSRLIRIKKGQQKTEADTFKQSLKTILSASKQDVEREIERQRETRKAKRKAGKKIPSR